VLVRNIKDNSCWHLVVVYGTPYEEYKLEFVQELQTVMESWNGPTMLGVDFNMVRS
jgi:hypothetical protein